MVKCWDNLFYAVGSVLLGFFYQLVFRRTQTNLVTEKYITEPSEHGVDFLFISCHISRKRTSESSYLQAPPPPPRVSLCFRNGGFIDQV